MASPGLVRRPSTDWRHCRVSTFRYPALPRTAVLQSGNLQANAIQEVADRAFAGENLFIFGLQGSLRPSLSRLGSAVTIQYIFKVGLYKLAMDNNLSCWCARPGAARGGRSPQLRDARRPGPRFILTQQPPAPAWARPGHYIALPAMRTVIGCKKDSKSLN